MNITQIAENFLKGRLSLLNACHLLDELGYTRQERRRIINGWQFEGLYIKS